MILKPKENLLLLFASIFILLYLILFLIPYANDHGFFNENIIPEGKEKLIYSLLSIPILILYSIYAIISIKKIKFLKCINYPLLIIVGYLGLFMCLIRDGGAVLWLMVLTIIIPIVLIPISMVIGINKDINYFRRNKKTTKN
ncbi:hypothetical protein [Paenibacillus sp. PAMC21692]|uniref:hypothetical protein n=1 Tax=Paenibacillus sp. PAMC21692 TaxID=2762320 RepID=UPI00164E7D22|nr:hypothetical protein [Paenibacillus sp. PAMC21692]QNK55150.1 hypothetical protein H7F31_21295 [Paenibacillus sp. PAMC21692]